MLKNITYKTISKAELGLTDSHQTHIGLSEECFDDWNRRVEIKTDLFIHYATHKEEEIETLLINDPISDPNRGWRSPKFRSGYENTLPSLRDAIVYSYRKHMTGENTPIFLLLNMGGNNLIAHLISTQHKYYKSFMEHLSTRCRIRNNSKEIYSKILYPGEKDFEIIKDTIRHGRISSENKSSESSSDRHKTNVRKDQQAFRIKVLSAYHHKCCVTDCDLVDAIEANHIVPHSQQPDNSIQNGIPMRSDIHRLWTSGLLGVSDDYRVIISGKVRNSEHYQPYEGKKINLPFNPEYRPNKEALAKHCIKHGLQNERVLFTNLDQ